MPNGGKRPGAGRKKGFKFPATLDKEMAREALREMVTAQLRPLVEAQVSNALGIKYLVSRDKKTGKFIHLTEEQVAQKIASGEDVLEMWEKPPNVEAFRDLLDRTLDKPKQHVDVEGNLKGGIVIRWQDSE